MWVLEEAVDRSWRGRLNKIEGGNYRKEKKLCSMFGRTSCCVETLSGRKSTTKWLSNDSLMDKGRVKFGISYVFISDTTRQKYGIASMSISTPVLNAAPSNRAAQRTAHGPHANVSVWLFFSWNVNTR